MQLSFGELREKEVVNTADGSCFGYADDIVIDTKTKEIVAIVIKGRFRFFGIFGREDDVFIKWDEIETIGKDIILVKTEQKGKLHNEKQNIIQKFLNIFFYYIAKTVANRAV